MAPRRPAKPKLTIVEEKANAEAAPQWDLPDDLDDVRKELAIGMLEALKEKHGVTAASDLELVANACRSAQRAYVNRELAKEAAQPGNDIRIFFRAEAAAAKNEADFRRACNDIGLDPRDRSNKTQQGLAAKSVGGAGSIWGDRLRKPLKR